MYFKMFRSVMPALKNCSRCRNRLPLFLHRTLAAKEQASSSKLAVPPALADSSKMLLNAFQEVLASNEVKLVRLVAIKIFTKSRILFRTHVLENPSFQASLRSMKTKIEQMQQSAEKEMSAKSDGEKKVKKAAKKVEGSSKPDEKCEDEEPPMKSAVK